MANEEQLSILKQGVEVWNKWRFENADVEIDLTQADLAGADLSGVNLSHALMIDARLDGARFTKANLRGANLFLASLNRSNLSSADLREVNLIESELFGTNLTSVHLDGSNLSEAYIGDTILVNLNLMQVTGLDNVEHHSPSFISTTTFVLSNGRVPEIFLRGCGLSDWEIEMVKLYNSDLNNQEINNIQYKMYDLRATQALQVSALFISYGHEDSKFVDKLENSLNRTGIRFWRDIHEMKAGRMETQIDRAIRQNPTVLLVLSEHSLSSDWVEHEVRTARNLEKELGGDALCPVALDDSWKDSRWPKRIMEQIMEYNILDFSGWQDDSEFNVMFRKLMDGLELFYKG